MWLKVLVIASLACQFFVGSMAYSSIVAYGKGAAVVEDVVDTINRLGIFPNDKKFLCRVAWVESKYGLARGTYRHGYYGGIWQVDRTGYLETVRNDRLKRYWSEIKAQLGIDWTKTNWQDLVKPLYSGLAARLYLVRIPAAIPSNLQSQGSYWKTYYNTVAGKGTVTKFINDVRRASGCAA